MGHKKAIEAIKDAYDRGMELNTMMNHDLKHALKYKDLEYRCFTHV